MIRSRSFEIRFTKRAIKDVKQLPPKLKKKLRDILEQTIAINPYDGKKLVGELSGNYSYRLSYKDRILYSIDEEHRIIYIKRTRTHYGE